MAIKKLLVISSGGDAPGMNATIRAVVRSAIHHGIAVYGSGMGYHGLINQHIFPLNLDSVANCIQRGGTILKTGRSEAFYKAEVRQQCYEFLKANNIDGMIVLGGNGSFQGAKLLSDLGDLKIIGIPCTIDNDIVGTDYCIGFDTARNTALSAIDKIRDTASSLDRNFIIEVMGRASGFLAVDVGIAGGAEIILIPEFAVSIEQLVDKIQQDRREKLSSIIVAAEADQPGHTLELAEKIKQLTDIEYRVCIIGHTQRGGSPTVEDRKFGSIMGAQAVAAIRRGESQKMLAMQAGKIVLTKLPDPKNAIRYFSDKSLLEMNDILCGI